MSAWSLCARHDEAALDALASPLAGALSDLVALLFDTLRLRVIKIGGWVRERTDSSIPNVCVHLSSHHPGQALWLLLARAVRIHTWRW